MTPKALIVASAQFLGQPLTAILNLCGIQLPQLICSSLTPRPVESCVPKRHHSDPTQVFTVRRDRKSDVKGKSVTVRVDLGGRRIIITKNHLIRQMCKSAKHNSDSTYQIT